MALPRRAISARYCAEQSRMNVLSAVQQSASVKWELQTQPRNSESISSDPCNVIDFSESTREFINKHINTF